MQTIFHDLRQHLHVQKCEKVCLLGMTETGPVEFHPLLEDSKETRINTVGFVTDHLEVSHLTSATNVRIVASCVIDHLETDSLKLLNTGHVADAITPSLCSDQIVLLEGGYAKVVGRLKEMIIRGGENIFPKEIEDLLQSHPDILEAQVFGVDDARLGEDVCCCLRLTDGSTLTPEGIRAYSKGKPLVHRCERVNPHFTNDTFSAMPGIEPEALSSIDKHATHWAKVSDNPCNAKETSELTPPSLPAFSTAFRG
uniref:AMP-binding enzyme C-terminal domain-containing protein n=1 Tax=Timema bartmani TaxID=61472 RepID=A0A7R9I6I2_9NEOP|nr:unnamed protein product [Timema bartmani]